MVPRHHQKGLQLTPANRDLFWRIEPGIELDYTEADFQKALAYRQQFDVDTAIDDIAATVAALRAYSPASSWATISCSCASASSGAC